MRGLLTSLMITGFLWAPVAASGGPLLGDTDGDGVDDLFDNCRDFSNTSQLDVDSDGCGNKCDGDFDQDGGSGGTDFFIFLACLGKAVGPGQGPLDDPQCLESDMDGDGGIAGTDFFVFLAQLGGTPGVSKNVLRQPPLCPQAESARLSHIDGRELAPRNLHASRVRSMSQNRPMAATRDEHAGIALRGATG